MISRPAPMPVDPASANTKTMKRLLRKYMVLLRSCAGGPRLSNPVDDPYVFRGRLAAMNGAASLTFIAGSFRKRLPKKR